MNEREDARSDSPAETIAPRTLEEWASATVAAVEAMVRHLRAILQVLVKHRRFAATCVAIAVGLALVVTLLTPRRYTASTFIPGASPAALGTELVALRSRDLAERVIRQRGLTAHPLFHPEGGGVASVSVDPRLLDRYASYLSVRGVRDAGRIEVSFTTPSPALSALLAVAHAEAYQEANPDAPRSPVEPPQVPTWPSRPDLRLNLALGLGAGLILAAAAVAAREVLDASLETEVKARATPAAIVARARDQLAVVGARVMGVILNEVRAASG